MNDIDTPAGAPAPSPHPLARDLAAFLVGRITPRVLLLGYGSGRNVPVLLRAGAALAIVDRDPARVRMAEAQYSEVPGVSLSCELPPPGSAARSFDAALSTHALLHGTPPSIADVLARVHGVLGAGAAFYLTLGSKNDPRFGIGRAVGPDTYAATDGSEAGIPHAYFDEAGVRALLRGFTIVELAEASARETAGSWAHTAAEAARLRHWFVRAVRAWEPEPQ